MDVKLSFSKCNILPETWFSFHGRKALFRPSYWFIKGMQNILLRHFLVRDYVDIFLLHDSLILLSSRVSDLW